MAFALMCQSDLKPSVCQQSFSHIYEQRAFKLQLQLVFEEPILSFLFLFLKSIVVGKGTYKLHELPIFH